MERDLLTKLVTRAQKGDSSAMDELFSAFYNDVYYFALKTVKDSDTACDITQETFLEIIRTIGNLKEPAAFVTWMKQITYHQCTRYFNKKTDLLVDEDEDGNTIFDTLADESEGAIPSEVCEREDFRKTILGIINELTEQQRSAVMMYYYDDLSVGQIAQIQGVSEGTVKSRLNYARKALKATVEDYEKKNNIKLHSFSFLPLFLLYFGKDLMPSAKAAQIQTVVSESASALGSGVAAAGGAAAGGASVAAAAEVAAAAGTGLLAKLAALPLVAKVIAAVVSVAIVIGGGTALLNNDHRHACEDLDGDCLCDACSAAVHHSSSDNMHEDFCALCGLSLGYYDENSDGTCDACGQFPCGEFHRGEHVDNGDGSCHLCNTNLTDHSLTSPESTTSELHPRQIRPEFCSSCGVEWDKNNDCVCDQCNWVEHYHGQGDACGTCPTCGAALLILDENRNNRCDLCGHVQCGDVHPHMRDEGFEYCFICGTWMADPIPTLEAPTITVVINEDSATVHISSVEGATGYQMFINGNHMGDGRYDTTGGTITITRDMLQDGENTVFVEAYNDQVFSPQSNTVSVNKLGNPEYHATGTGVEFPWGDVENAQGYIIYGDDGEYLATIPVGSEYDFSSIYTEDGFYFPHIQAYAQGWISSEKCGIPVTIGEGGGPIGYPS